MEERREGVPVQAVVSMTISGPDLNAGCFTTSVSLGPLSNPKSPRNRPRDVYSQRFRERTEQN